MSVQASSRSWWNSFFNNTNKKEDHWIVALASLTLQVGAVCAASYMASIVIPKVYYKSIQHQDHGIPKDIIIDHHHQRQEQATILHRETEQEQVEVSSVASSFGLLKARSSELENLRARLAAEAQSIKAFAAELAKARDETEKLKSMVWSVNAIDKKPDIVPMPAKEIQQEPRIVAGEALVVSKQEAVKAKDTTPPTTTNKKAIIVEAQSQPIKPALGEESFDESETEPASDDSTSFDDAPRHGTLHRRNTTGQMKKQSSRMSIESSSSTFSYTPEEKAALRRERRKNREQFKGLKRFLFGKQKKNKSERIQNRSSAVF